MEHLKFNLLYQWFVGLKADDKLWDETVFTKNRDRLFEIASRRDRTEPVFQETVTSYF